MDPNDAKQYAEQQILFREYKRDDFLKQSPQYIKSTNWIGKKIPDEVAVVATCAQKQGTAGSITSNKFDLTKEQLSKELERYMNQTGSEKVLFIGIQSKQVHHVTRLNVGYDQCAFTDPNFGKKRGNCKDVFSFAEEVLNIYDTSPSPQGRLFFKSKPTGSFSITESSAAPKKASI